MKMEYFKNVFLTGIIVFIGLNTFAQAPEGFTYQAEARDTRGKVITGTSLTVRASILTGASVYAASVAWSKDYSVRTDDYGLFDIVIGDAAGETAFAGINWGSGKYYLKIQIRYGIIWIDMGTTQLWSVPYALYAKTAGTGTNYTDAEKAKLAGIQAGAEVNVQPDWSQSNSTRDDYIKNKPGLATVATSGKYSDLSGTPAGATPFSSGLMSATDKLKLDGIATGAEVNVQSDWNQSNSTKDDFIKNKPALKAVATSGSYTDLSNTPAGATATLTGLMSAADKAKLNGIAAGAEVNVQTDWAQADNTKDDYLKNKPVLKAVATSGSYTDLSNTPAGATATSTGLMSATDKAKLDGIAANANNYVHPTGDGNQHVPATGTVNNGKVLMAGSTAGSLNWAAMPSAPVTSVATRTGDVLLTKADVGLSNVENTALSTWPGNTSLTTLGTITTGTWNASTIPIIKGGTGATTKAAAFDALSPMTTAGDLIYGGTSGTGTRLAAGTAGQFLKMNSGATAPEWSSQSLVNFTESNYTFNSKTGVKLFATNVATDVDIVLQPKGTGAIIAQQPDGKGMSGGVTGGGNERGSNAVDLQTGRILNTHVASGDNSVIIGGFGNTASGRNSIAMGIYTIASGNYAISMGGSSEASGISSTSMGSHTQASGDYSTAIGAYTTAPSGYETVIGRYNTEYTQASTISWDNNDRLFVLGNGTSASARRNALTILKNANTTIGGSLTINGNGTDYMFPTGRGSNGQVLTSNGSGGVNWATPSGGTVTGVGGTAPIVSSVGTTPVISITAATSSEAGSMSAADKAKLDGIAPGAEVNVNADWNATSGDAQILNKPVGTAPGQMMYWSGTAWAIVPSGLNGQILKYKNGVPTWVDGNINDLSIGDSYQGGIIAYFLAPDDPGYDANLKHGIIAAPADQSTGIPWYNGSNLVTGATERILGTGNANTNKIVTAQGSGSYAAQLCADLELGGYSDWYLPSRYELEKLELNKMAIGGFASAWYWSSTEFNDVYAERVDFGYHIPPILIDLKSNSYRVRAIRSF